MYVITALMIGLVGSLHCIGMCGPIAVALPLGNKGWGYRVFGGLTYNVGRIISYAVLGAVFGLLGQGIEMAGLQKWASKMPLPTINHWNWASMWSTENSPTKPLPMPSGEKTSPTLPEFLIIF